LAVGESTLTIGTPPGMRASRPHQIGLVDRVDDVAGRTVGGEGLELGGLAGRVLQARRGRGDAQRDLMAPRRHPNI
jgi:hypothetical protein